MMITVLSPAKALDFSENWHASGASRPEFEADALELAAILRGKTANDLSALMGLSDTLAELNVGRFERFGSKSSRSSEKPAALAFAGDTYQGLQATELTQDDLHFAQGHLRILSGLYGVLRPLDVIEPYRLEMGTRLETQRGKTLYAYWGDRVARSLEAAAEGGVILNCASQEYFKVAERHLSVPVITPQFKEERGNELKMISFYAKKARGALARFVVVNRVTDAKDLLAFDYDGYRFRDDLSEDGKPVFTRKAEAPTLAK